MTDGTEVDGVEVAVGTLTKGADGAINGRLRHVYPGHSRAEIWRMLTDPAGIAEWIAPGSIELRKGGKVKIDFADSGTLIESEVLDIEPECTLSYSWSSGDEPDRPLRFDIEDVEGGVALDLSVHVPAGEDAAKACAGFEGHLHMLAGALEGVPIKFPFPVYLAARTAYSAQIAAL